MATANLPLHTDSNLQSAVTCDNLNLKRTDDKTTYIFTASTSGNTDVITSYTFDFGDHQSYRVTLPANQKNRGSARTTHHYKAAGTYIAKVRVHTNTSSQDITSDTCKVSVGILPEGTTLPDTGARYHVVLLLLSAGAATVIHQLWLRRRLKGQPGL